MGKCDYTHKIIDGNFIILQQNLYESKRKIMNMHILRLLSPFDYLKFYGVNVASGFKKTSVSFVVLLIGLF